MELNKIYFQDCLQGMQLLDGESVQMVLVDLPYGITSNKWDCEISLDKLWEQYLRIGKDNAIFAFTCSQPFTSKLVCSNIEMWKHEWVWIKNRGSNFANTVREPFKEHETIQIFSRGKWIYNKQMQSRTGTGINRVKYSVAFKSKSKNYREFKGKSHTYLPEMRVPSSWQKWNTDTSRMHPTIKPIEMGEYLINTYTNEGDLVLDNCCGSGTFCLAAKNRNRNFIGFENNEEYYKIAIKRIETLT